MAHIVTVSPGVDVLPLKVDVRVEAEIVNGIARVIRKFRRIDYTVNSAGKPMHSCFSTGGWIRIITCGLPRTTMP